jgi:hypothetical protein
MQWIGSLTLSGQTKDFKINICYFSAKHTELGSKSRDLQASGENVMKCQLVFAGVASGENVMKCRLVFAGVASGENVMKCRLVFAGVASGENVMKCLLKGLAL